MSNLKKITASLRKYILDQKVSHPDISCRDLSEAVKTRFKQNISKSAINNLLKGASLSSPVGRRVSAGFRDTREIDGAGYIFLLGANRLTGLSGIMASLIKKEHPELKIGTQSIEAITEAWIMAKAMYSVSLDKIADYHKNELWFLLGRRVSKGMLKGYIRGLGNLQTIINQLVIELSYILQDIRYLTFFLEDGSKYYIDGRFKSIWSGQAVPHSFAVTIDIVDSYIKNIFFGSMPTFIFNVQPESGLGEEITNFIFSIDGSSQTKRIRRIEYADMKGKVVKDVPFVVPEKRKFVLGIWPWQYKPASELENRLPQGKISLEPMGREVYYCETLVKFTQHVGNIDVMLRLIVLKPDKEGPIKIALLTNLLSEKWSVERVVGEYMRLYPDLEAGHAHFLEAVKKPEYFENMLTCEKITPIVKKISEAMDADSLFAGLVEILNAIAKKSFFPEGCVDWSLLKMKEIFYKQKGTIKRDVSRDILFNLLYPNMLHEKKFLDYAVAHFNESKIFDFSGKKPLLKIIQ